MSNIKFINSLKKQFKQNNTTIKHTAIKSKIMKFIKIEDQLPPKNTLVWIKRIPNKVEESPIYLGMRNGRPISTDKDASRNCHWNANHISKLTSENDNSFGFAFNSSFSDVTVIGWALLRCDYEH
jgi:hypothetical protein